MKEHTIHISPKSFFFIALFAVSVYIIFLIWHTLLLLFVSLLFATLIEPFANALQKRHIPRSLSAIIVYVVLFGIIGLALAVLIPVVVRDLPPLFENVVTAFNNFKTQESFQRFFGTESLTQGSLWFLPTGGGEGSGLSSVVARIGDVFGGLISLVVVLVITFYLVIEENPLEKVLHSLVPQRHLPFTLSLIQKIREKLGLWLRGQLILSAIVATLTFLLLTAFHIKYAAIIALLAGLLELVPYVGPIFSALPALFFAYSQGGVVTTVLIFFGFFIIQQFENHVLIPKVMQKAVGLNPIISIIALIIGLQIGGILGGILSIPVATTVQVIMEELFMRKNIEEKKEE